MATVRIQVRKNLPTTDFYLYADRVGQDISGNYTTVRMYLGAINRGNTTSYANGFGQQGLGISGIANLTGYTANPFIVRGVQNGVQRWLSGPYDVQVPHNPDGTRGAVTLYMTLAYIDEPYAEWTAPFNDFPAIPRGPKVKHNGTWKNTVPYVKHNGSWKIAIPFVKQSGSWKNSGG